MTISAFQPNAFQNNAFQVNTRPDTHDGANDAWLKHHRKKRDKEAERLKKKYKKLLEKLPGTPRIISAVDAFVVPTNREEWERRTKAQPIFETAPPVDRVDFAAIAQNKIAQERFNQTISLLKTQIKELIERQQEEEQMVLVILMMEM